MGSAGDISLVDDFPKVQSYLYRLEKQLKYMFSNLEPDENYTEQARLIYVANQEKQASIEVSLDHINLEMVRKDEVVSAINLSEEGVKILGDKISLEGVVTVNSRFKIGLDGSMEANNGIFQGDISASNITGSTLTGGTINAGGTSDGKLIVYNSSGTEIGRWDKEGIKVKSGTIEGTGITVGGSGNAGTITVKNSGGTPIGTWDNTGIDVKAGTLAGTTISGSTINVGGTGTAGSIVVKDGAGNSIGSWTKDGVTINKGTINGPSITLGGANNASGTLTIKNASGTTIGTWNNNGINVSSGSITGINFTLGGQNNASGTLTVKNASGTTIGTWNNNGISITGGTISGPTISGGTISGGTITGTAVSGGTVSGAAISGGTITGTTFNGETFNGGEFNGEVSFNCGDYFSIENVGDNRDYMFTLGGFQFGYDDNLHEHFFGSTGGMSDFEVTQTGEIWANDVHINGKTDTLENLLADIYDTGGMWDRLIACEDALGL